MNNSFLQLPYKFEISRLLNDLKISNQFEYTNHFVTSNYQGIWSVLALRSPHGNTITAHATSADDYKDTSLLQACPYFKNIISMFKCPKASIRLLKLEPNSEIKEHTDYNLSYEDGCFRLHIPILTNDAIAFYINHELVTMTVGSCYYGDFNLPHRVKNNGDTSRIHLVMDCFRNEWTDDVFKKSGYNFELENMPQEYDDDTKRAMLEQLKLMNTEASKDLIKKLKSELKKN